MNIADRVEKAVLELGKATKHTIKTHLDGKGYSVDGKSVTVQQVAAALKHLRENNRILCSKTRSSTNEYVHPHGLLSYRLMRTLFIDFSEVSYAS